jgi:asparagine N-glycosylation enzyme membrane subunit Stt3
VLAVQAVAGALVVGLVFLMGCRCLDARAAHLAAAFALIFPDLTVYSLLDLSDMPYLALSLTASLLMMRVIELRKQRRFERNIRAAPSAPTARRGKANCRSN